MSKMSGVQYRNKFNSLNYDRLNIFVPKGRKKDIVRCAVENETSINGLVCAFLQAKLGLTDEEWKRKEE